MIQIGPEFTHGLDWEFDNNLINQEEYDEAIQTEIDRQYIKMIRDYVER